MNLEQSLEKLFRRNLHTMKLDLEPMRALLGELGNPHQRLVCIHIAGSNGKGSVAAMLESILRAQGYRTGLYTSPHLLRFNERIQINRQPVADDDLVALIAEVERAAARLPGLGHRDVTFFEFTTALAFLYFARRGIDVAVIETGMGGRLDATNLIVPAVSIITSISLEHVAYLGDTLAKIAAEKAGIIKRGRPVVVGALPPEAIEVIQQKARADNAPVRMASDLINAQPRPPSLDGQKAVFSSAHMDYGTIRIGLSGIHQVGNASTAITACECLDREIGLPVSTEAIKKGLAGVAWPARLQMLESDPPVILDGAHNPEAAHALAVWLRKVSGKKPVGMIASFLNDKDPRGFMMEFDRLVRRVWLVPVESERAMPVHEIRRRMEHLAQIEEAGGLEDAIKAARAWARSEGGVVVITGSLYLAGEVLNLYSLPKEQRKECKK